MIQLFQRNLSTMETSFVYSRAKDPLPNDNIYILDLCGNVKIHPVFPFSFLCGKSTKHDSFRTVASTMLHVCLELCFRIFVDFGQLYLFDVSFFFLNCLIIEFFFFLVKYICIFYFLSLYLIRIEKKLKDKTCNFFFISFS